MGEGVLFCLLNEVLAVVVIKRTNMQVATQAVHMPIKANCQLKGVYHVKTKEEIKSAFIFATGILWCSKVPCAESISIQTGVPYLEEKPGRKAEAAWLFKFVSCDAATDHQ